jgi:hypothetical protein
MEFRWLLDPQVFYRSRHDAILIPVACALITVGLCHRQAVDLAEYRELRYGTETATGVVVSKSTRYTQGLRARQEALIVYNFKAQDGRIFSGEMAYPPIRVAHLQPGTPVDVYYKPDKPERSATADGLYIRLWLELVPQAGFLAFFLTLTSICAVVSLRRWRTACESGARPGRSVGRSSSGHQG